MKLHAVLQALLIAAVSGEPLTNSTRGASSGDDSQSILKNRGGWVNPEDLAPMPQCIAQQDQSAWLDAMTKCTRHRCTSYFIFCTRYQWLTELSCLSAEFSPSIVKRYSRYCSRSILAKAQLHHWIKTTTGRNWLVDVGDAYSLHNLSPESLVDGYSTIDIPNKAPACLKESPSAGTRETFDHVIGSCSFTATTQHTGNADRPWEYNSRRNSMTSLSFDTASYDLTNSHIPAGEYFDKACFCNTFSMSQHEEPCSATSPKDLESQRRWMNETCGYTWHEPTRLQPRDMIPWRWRIFPRSPEDDAKCPSREWKLMSIGLINLVTLFAILHANNTRQSTSTNSRQLFYDPARWILGGVLLGCIHLLANLANATIVQTTPGYEDIPAAQLMLLWCSLPRLSWLPISSHGTKNPDFQDMNSSMSAIFAEAILQAFSFYHMCLTVNYGRIHDFYFGALSRATRSPFAVLMFGGALAWLFVVAMMAVPVVRTIRTRSRPSEKGHGVLNGGTKERTGPEEEECLLPKSHAGSEGHNYGTLPAEVESLPPSMRRHSRLHMSLAMGVPLLWLAQWLFWIGYIGLSSSDFCLPSLETLTGVWLASSLGSIIIRSYLFRFTGLLHNRYHIVAMGQGEVGLEVLPPPDYSTSNQHETFTMPTSFTINKQGDSEVKFNIRGNPGSTPLSIACAYKNTEDDFEARVNLLPRKNENASPLATVKYSRHSAELEFTNTSPPLNITMYYRLLGDRNATHSFNVSTPERMFEWRNLGDGEGWKLYRGSKPEVLAVGALNMGSDKPTRFEFTDFEMAKELDEQCKLVIVASWLRIWDKCTGEFPTCFACQRRGGECHYADIANDREMHSNQLKKRVKELEDENRSFRSLFQSLRKPGGETNQEILRRIQAGDDFRTVVEHAGDLGGQGKRKRSPSPNLMARQRPSDWTTIRGTLPRTPVTSPAAVVTAVLPILASPSPPTLPSPPIDTPTSPKDAVLGLLTLSQKVKPDLVFLNEARPNEHCDLRLNELSVSYWTRVPISNRSASILISTFLETDNSAVGFIDKDLFLTDLVQHNPTFCSAFLVSSILYLACFAHAASDGRAATLAHSFFNDAERLYRAERLSDSLTTLAAINIFSLGCFSHGNDNLGQDLLLSGRQMGNRMNLYGLDAASSEVRELQKLSSDHAESQACWGTLNWLTDVNLNSTR
ncbi:hypothetical protein F52700_10856 [Fusarium sp. NRRL 52700]|nr:hypothetical protein F52700_10856 [Fusarium sp. NRRL 52700]